MNGKRKRNWGLSAVQKYGALILFVAVWELVCLINESVEFINPGLFPAPHTQRGERVRPPPAADRRRGPRCPRPRR